VDQPIGWRPEFENAVHLVDRIGDLFFGRDQLPMLLPQVKDIAWTDMEPAAQRRRNRDSTLVGNDCFHPCHNAYRLPRLIASDHERGCSYGFGIFNFGTLTLTNCTLSGNSGYAISTDSGATLKDCTLSENGGAISIVHFCGSMGCGGGSEVTLTNTVIAESAGVTCRQDFGALIDGGHNLQWPGTSCGETIQSLDPKLDPAGLKDNGGTGSVTVNEIITLVNIALGNAQPSACPYDVPSAADVDVALIIQAVNVALTGCGG